MKRFFSYFISILISLGVGISSALLTMGSMNVYETLNTPPLSPPAFLFPIVWTLLYILMGVSAAMIYNSTSAGDGKVKALFTYAVSLFVNFFFSIFFFNFRAFTLSFVWLILLFLLVLLTIIDYSKINRVAAYLQIPYLLWVAFAGYLTLGIVILN